MDPDPDSDPDPAIFVIDLQEANKKLIVLKKFFCLRVHFYHFSKIKSQKEVTKQLEIKIFQNIFFLNDRRIRIWIHTSD